MCPWRLPLLLARTAWCTCLVCSSESCSNVISASSTLLAAPQFWNTFRFSWCPTVTMICFVTLQLYALYEALSLSDDLIFDCNQINLDIIIKRISSSIIDDWSDNLRQMALVTEILCLCGFALFITTPLRQQNVDLISGHFEDLQPELCVFDILCIFVTASALFFICGWQRQGFKTWHQSMTTHQSLEVSAHQCCSQSLLTLTVYHNPTWLK